MIDHDNGPFLVSKGYGVGRYYKGLLTPIARPAAQGIKAGAKQLPRPKKKPEPKHKKSIQLGF